MTAKIIDGFKIININNDQRKGALVTTGTLELLIQTFKKTSAIAQAGQGIAQSQDLLLHQGAA